MTSKFAKYISCVSCTCRKYGDGSCTGKKIAPNFAFEGVLFYSNVFGRPTGQKTSHRRAGAPGSAVWPIWPHGFRVVRRRVWTTSIPGFSLRAVRAPRLWAAVHVRRRLPPPACAADFVAERDAGFGGFGGFGDVCCAPVSP